MADEINQQIEKELFDKAANEYVHNGSASVQRPLFVLKGRTKIMTNYLSPSQVKEGMTGYIPLTDDNMPQALTYAMRVHRDNAREIEYLMDYYKGQQDILGRVKEVRSDVDNKVVVNYASSFTRDIMGYTFGKPMQYIARRTDDESDSADSPIKDELRLLADYSELADKSASDQEKATDASICGISHRAVFMNKDYEQEDESPFTYMNLDSRNTFVAYSSQLGGNEVFACTYVTSPDENEQQYTLYTVYTKDKIYQYKTMGISDVVMKENLLPGYPKPNPLGICIVENENNQFRMGHWETAITLMNAINKVTSDSVNDIEQFVNAILVAVNAEFTEETLRQVREEHYAEIRSPQGLQADLKYIQAQLDASVEDLRQYLEDCLRVVVGIPDRKTRGGGGGDTGDAVKLRDGWADMEVVARTTEIFNKKSEKKELRIILKILKTLNLIKDLSMINIDLKYPRNKTDNLSTKVQAIATLNNTKLMAPEDMLEIGDITTDIAEVVQRGEIYWKKKSDEAFEDQQRQLKMMKSMSGDEDGTRKGDEGNGRKQFDKQSGDKPVTGFRKSDKPNDKQSGKQSGK